MKSKLSTEKAYAIEAIHLHCVDLPTRQIWIHGTPLVASSAEELGNEPGVEYMMATKTIKNLHILKSESNDDVIVHLHTCGGIWEEGMAIYDTIKSMPYHVTIVSYTHARSMSSIILQAADNRVLMPNSYFLFHRGHMYLNADALTASSIHEYYNKIANKKMIDIYVDKMIKSDKFKDKTEKQLYKIVEDQMNQKGDVYLTAEEAVEWGFADKVFTTWENLNK